MTEQEVRRCVFCGAFLSRFNDTDVCGPCADRARRHAEALTSVQERLSRDAHELHTYAVRLRSIAAGPPSGHADWMDEVADACLLVARSLRPEPHRDGARWDGLPKPLPERMSA